MITQYQCIVDGGHFVASIGTFSTEQDADFAGKDWLIDNGLVWSDAEDCYADTTTGEPTECGYEVVEVETPSEDDTEEAEDAEEQSLDYFNRYIAGDR